MRWLRLLTNASVAGLLAALYVAVLFLQLNPQLPLDPATLSPLLVVVVGFYALHATAIFLVLILIRQVLSRAPLSPAWLSLRLLSWLTAAAATGAALLMWWNLDGLRTALTDDVARRLGIGAVAMGLCAAALLTIAVVHYSFGRRGSAVGVSLYAIAVVASITLPLAARGPAIVRPLRAHGVGAGALGPPVEGRLRVTMLLLDGASLDYLSVATAEGRLPNFGRVLDAGAAMHLATLRPTQPSPVWATVATGTYPPRHGVISTSTYRAGPGMPALSLLPDYCFAQALVFLGLLDEVPASSAELRVDPLWSVASSHGIPVGVVGVPVTHPVRPLRGFVVSDQFHELVDPTGEPESPGAVYPRAVAALGAEVIRDVGGGERLNPTGAASEASLVPPAAVEPIWRDRVYGRLGRDLYQRFADVRLFALRYRGLDLAGHRFLPVGTPIPFLGLGDVVGDPASLEAYYGHVDAELGALLEGMGPDDLLLVVSGFGMEPLGVSKRVLARMVGDPDLTGTHEHAPDGFLLAYGAHVAPGRPARGSVVDVAPTVLYFLGVPVARDTDGVARTDLFTPEFTEQHPIAFVPSYRL